MAADTPAKRDSAMRFMQPFGGARYPDTASAGARAANLYLYALAGASLITVPDVVGDDQATGTATLEGDGFVVAVVLAFSSIVAAGDIISQDPAAGSDEPLGSTVTITVSLGDAPDATSRNYYMTMQRQVPNAIAITPSDSTTYKPALIALRVGTTAGTLVVRSGGATVTIPGVLVGETIYVSCNQVMAASTAVGITGFQWPD